MACWHAIAQHHILSAPFSCPCLWTASVTIADFLTGWPWSQPLVGSFAKHSLLGSAGGQDQKWLKQALAGACFVGKIGLQQTFWAWHECLRKCLVRVRHCWAGILMKCGRGSCSDCQMHVLAEMLLLVTWSSSFTMGETTCSRCKMWAHAKNAKQNPATQRSSILNVMLLTKVLTWVSAKVVEVTMCARSQKKTGFKISALPAATRFLTENQLVCTARNWSKGEGHCWRWSLLLCWCKAFLLQQSIGDPMQGIKKKQATFDVVPGAKEACPKQCNSNFAEVVVDWGVFANEQTSARRCPTQRKLAELSVNRASVTVYPPPPA